MIHQESYRRAVGFASDLSAAGRALVHAPRRALTLARETIRQLRIRSAPELSIYRIDPENLGDLKSAPAAYFDFLAGMYPLDLYEYCSSGVELDRKLVVLGGGGVFVLEKELQSLAASPSTTLICWGAGHNTHGDHRIGRVGLLDRFALVGIRDHGQGYEWVPCASCMDPAFDRSDPVEHDVVIYDHRHYRVGEEDPSIPRMSNSCADFDAVIRFLGSAATVLTSTYHGAYWATLLGRQVIVVDPFSSKFFGLKHPPVMTSSNEWRDALGRVRSYPEALDECRSANRSFAEKAFEVIEGHRRTRGRRGPRPRTRL
jgi:hypothetical protein